MAVDVQAVADLVSRNRELEEALRDVLEDFGGCYAVMGRSNLKPIVLFADRTAVVEARRVLSTVVREEAASGEGD
jgi:hypothetical protein